MFSVASSIGTVTYHLTGDANWYLCLPSVYCSGLKCCGKTYDKSSINSLQANSCCLLSNVSALGKASDLVAEMTAMAAGLDQSEG